ncbi:MAG: acyl-CoA dehydrogenase family protein, partial [Halobaculum sp.]
YSDLDRARDCNYWALDPTLRREAARAYPTSEFEWAVTELDAYGETVGHRIAPNAARVDRHSPQLRTHDREGNRRNEVEYHPDQIENERLTYERHRLTHDAFHAPPDREEPVGLLHPLTMQTLLCYADVGFACPASMTTGAAVVLDQFGLTPPERREKADSAATGDTAGSTPDTGADGDSVTFPDYFGRLTAADYGQHAEGAMFITESQGGSDVGANEVRAEPQADGSYAITGEKWFCSNVDAEGALVLARTPDAPDGTEGLSLFLVPRELPDGSVNDTRVRRLKDKLGTLSVPTGEIEYEGATGYLVGEREGGFRAMTEMINYERLTNATGAVGLMGRALLAGKVWTANREAFGQSVQSFPLLRRDLSRLTVTYEAAAAFAFEAARWYDRRMRAQLPSGPDTPAPGTRGTTDSSSTGDDRSIPDTDALFADTHDTADTERLVRLLTPVAKYETAALAVDVTSEACELLGGNGYVREFETPRLLRDAQVLPIWEGTSNVLSLETLRVLHRKDAHEALFPLVRRRIETADDRLDPVTEAVESAFLDLQTALGTLATADDRTAQYHAKRLADQIYDVVAAAVLLTEASRELVGEGPRGTPDGRTALVAAEFAATRFCDGDEIGSATDADGPQPFGDEWFDVIARYDSVDPETAVEAVTARML